MAEENTKEEMKPFSRHSYPILIKIFGLALLGIWLYSLFLLPKYFEASKYLQAGERYLKLRDYDNSVIELKKVLEAVPSSRRAKTALLTAYRGLNYRKTSSDLQRIKK